MRKKGFYSCSPVVLALWPGLETPPVLIDGHVRWLAARDVGLEEIPCIIIEFPDQMSALELCIDLQTARRQTSDGVIFSITEKFDTLKRRGGDRKSQTSESKIANAIFEKERTSSAKETATLIGCHYTKVDRTRTIRRYGSPEIQEAVRKDEMTIHKAWKMIRDVQVGKDDNKRNAAHTSAAKKLLTEENFEVLKALGGDIYEKINAAIEYYRSSLNGTERVPDPEE
jgi:ParB family chromosome partitioning protein